MSQYLILGALLSSIGLFGLLGFRALGKRLISANILASGVFIYLVSSNVGDPVPQALVLTGLVVSVSATALAVALIKLVYEQ
ncbi:MAG: NADH-quinone oxidoreductase subunit K [Aquificaceae bacterium]|nr:NADH-quinone oxidoreductase subunit K [Aquificaceae bacterium]MDW8237123.1 NADH-quinone oxidoreductase subunit K [Aquificaceae bacterium]